MSEIRIEKLLEVIGRKEVEIQLLRDATSQYEQQLHAAEERGKALLHDIEEAKKNTKTEVEEH